MSALTEKIAAEHQPRYVEMRGHEADDFTYGWRCSCGNTLRGSAIHRSMRNHVAEATEAAVRAQIAAEIEQVASDRSYDSHESITDAYLDAARIALGAPIPAPCDCGIECACTPTRKDAS